MVHRSLAALIVAALVGLAAATPTSAQSCTDFGSQAAAQGALDADKLLIDALDPDLDGVACGNAVFPTGDIIANQDAPPAVDSSAGASGEQEIITSEDPGQTTTTNEPGTDNNTSVDGGQVDGSAPPEVTAPEASEPEAVVPEAMREAVVPEVAPEAVVPDAAVDGAAVPDMATGEVAATTDEATLAAVVADAAAVVAGASAPSVTGATTSTSAAAAAPLTSGAATSSAPTTLPNTGVGSMSGSSPWGLVALVAALAGVGLAVGGRYRRV